MSIPLSKIKDQFIALEQPGPELVVKPVTELELVNLIVENPSETIRKYVHNYLRIVYNLRRRIVYNLRRRFSALFNVAASFLQIS